VQGGDNVNDPNADTNNQTDPNAQDNTTVAGEGDSQQTDNETDGQAARTEDDTEWKSINLLNAREKRRSWTRQNQRRKSLEASFYRDLKSDYRELTHRLARLANKLKGRDIKLIEFAMQKEIDDFSPELTKTLKRHIRYTLEDFGSMVLGEGKSLNIGIEKKANLKFDSFVSMYIERHTGTQIKTINSTNEKNIKRIVAEWVQESITAGDSLPELSKFIEAEFEGLSAGSARRIARTEVGMASNNGSLEAVKSLQVPGIYKEWVSAQDDRVRPLPAHSPGESYPDHVSANGMEVPLDDKFTVPPDASMDGPGDPGSEAGQVINCRCVLVYKQKGDN
jgi:hypothetical protein